MRDCWNFYFYRNNFTLHFVEDEEEKEFIEYFSSLNSNLNRTCACVCVCVSVCLFVCLCMRGIDIVRLIV